MSSSEPPIHFILVDDLEENLVALEALLKRDGLILLKARSGEEALELLLDHEVALALLDVQMPGMDGFELAELMRGNERTRHIPIIFVTAGTADRNRRFRGYEAGAVDFIQKPIEADILRSKANVFFGLYRLRQQIAAQRDALAEQTRMLQEFEQLTREQLVREQETAKFREQFIAVLGHDLRNPLASISGAARILRREPQSEKSVKIISLMEASVDRMAELIDNVMDFARGRLGGGIAVSPRATALDPVLQHLIDEVQASHPDRKIETRFVLPGPVCLDAARISQLVSNLLANALTHGDPTSPVRVVAIAEDEELKISVTNMGPEISDAAKERLFEPFIRGEAGPNQGLGLGLHIAAEIAKAHGGTLCVSSNMQETCFTFSMPASAEI